MAAKAGFRKSLEHFVDKNEIIWSNEVVKRLKWSAGMWEKEGEIETFWFEMVNSVKVWGRKLAKVFTETNVIFGLHDGKAFGKIDMVAVLEGLVQLKPDILINGFSETRNPRYVVISFLDIQTKNFVLENYITFDKYNVIFLNWASDCVQWDIVVEWLPVEVSLTETKLMLSSFFEIVEEERVNCVLMSGMMVPTGKVTFKGVLINALDIYDVPYIASVNDLDCKIKIVGRRIKCFDCGVLGHVARRCPKFVCLRCFDKLSPDHSCAVITGGKEGGALGLDSVVGSQKPKDAQLLLLDQELLVGKLAASSVVIDDALVHLINKQSIELSPFWSTAPLLGKEEEGSEKQEEGMEAQLLTAKRKLDGTAPGGTVNDVAFLGVNKSNVPRKTYAKKAFIFGEKTSDNLFYNAVTLPDHNG